MVFQILFIYLKEKSYDKYLELQSKWDKELGVQGYYVEIIGNIIDEVVKSFYDTALWDE